MERAQNSNKPENPQEVAYECKSCHEITRGLPGETNYCEMCGKELDKTWGLRTGHRSGRR